MATRAERRRKGRAESKATEKGEASPDRARKRNLAIGAVLLVGLVGGIGYLAFTSEDVECPGHWHATFAIFIDGEQVTFPQPPYNMDLEGGKLPKSLHMHAPDQQQLHFEPERTECVGIQETLASLDVEIKPGSLGLTGGHSGGPHDNTYVDEGNRTLRVFIESPEGEMREEQVRDILDYQLRDGEKLLVAYGEYSQGEVDVMMDAIHDPAG